MENEKSIGALWEKVTKQNISYFTGNIEINGEKIKIVCFKNKNKVTEKYPDFVIYKNKERIVESKNQNISF